MLHFDGETVRQDTAGETRVWELPELLDAYDPLAGEPLAVRNAMLRQVLPAALDRYEELSDAARLRCDFWKNLQTGRIEQKCYEYTTKVSHTYAWRLEVNPEGLFFTDLSGEYGPAGRTYPQLFSDFWFCGPLRPLPALTDRKWVISQIRNAFLQVGGAAYSAHFPLFDYPDLGSIDPPQWQTGDYRAGDFVIVRRHGIDYGRHNFHDGLVFVSFLSFEQALCRADAIHPILSPGILADIRAMLRPPAATGEAPPSDRNATAAMGEGPSARARSRQLYFDNGGMVHYIYRDGFGEEYEAGAPDEAAWKQELIQSYYRRLEEEHNEVVLRQIVQTLQYHRAANVEDRLLRRAAAAPAREKQAIALVLWEDCRSEYSADILLTLLQEEDDYWRQYVFSAFARMSASSRVQQWVRQQAGGADPYLRGKAQDILRLWALSAPADKGRPPTLPS